MRDWLEAYKPAAPAQVHLLLAAIMWTSVGTLLLFFGVRWVLAGRIPHGSLLLAAAAVAGLVKARFVLKRSAGRVIERIRTRGDGRCIGGFLSVWSWLFVAVMVGAGRLIRTTLLPAAVTGLVYVAVGTALLLAAGWLWQAWYRHGADA